MRSRRVIALVTSILAAAAPTAIPVAGASAAPTQAVVPYFPQVGNSAFLVYLQNSGTCTKPDTSLRVRNVDGTIRPLGLKGYAKASFNDAGLAGYCEFNSASFSLSGHTLTTELKTPTGGFAVFWWDLTSDHHGHHPVPADDQYEGAMPGGWIYRQVTNSGYSTELVRETTAGKLSSYGTFKEFDRVVTGTRGLVLVNDDRAISGTVQSNLRYLAYGTSKPVQLMAPAKKSGETSMRCTAVTSTYVACAAASNSGDVDTPYVQGITPLDGSASHRCDAATCYENDGFQRTTASPAGVTTALSDGKLVTLQPDGTTVTGDSHGTVDTGGFNPLVTAYGQIIVLHASDDVTEQTAVTSAETLLFTGWTGNGTR